MADGVPPLKCDAILPPVPSFAVKSLAIITATTSEPHEFVKSCLQFFIIGVVIIAIAKNWRLRL